MSLRTVLLSSKAPSLARAERPGVTVFFSRPRPECSGLWNDDFPLNELADWLVEQRVESVAMESTHVYWVPVYELLESRGLEAILVNARQFHNVPERKTDFADCHWIQLLHSCGL